MSLKIWALKPGELKALDRAELLLLAARCGLRVEPWVPRSAAKRCAAALREIAGAAFAPPLDGAAVRPLRREISDLGASACNSLQRTDEPLGRCQNYATQTLACALDAATLADRKALVKAVIDVAKASAAPFAVWAHAGRVASTSGDPVTEVCETTWAAIRSDVAAVARSTQRVREASDPVAALRAVAALWPQGEEAWTAPPA